MPDNAGNQAAHNRAATAGNVAEPYVERVITLLVGKLTDTKAVEAIIRDLSPFTAGLIYEALPGLVGFAISKAPDSWFTSPEAAQFCRSMVNELVKSLGDRVKAKRAGGGGELTADDKQAAVDATFKTVSGTELVVDPLGHLHLGDCVSVRHAIKAEQLTKVMFDAAIRQGLRGSPCCFERIKTEVQAPAVTPAKSQKGRSPFEVLGAMDPKLRADFDAWLVGLSADQRRHAVELLEELDSEAELRGFMSIEPALRLELLPLLADRNGKHAARKFLGVLGVLAKAGFDQALAAAKTSWSEYRAFNARLQPAVNRERRRLRAPRRPNPWWRLFLPF
jgi:hypothetical protein